MSANIQRNQKAWDILSRMYWSPSGWNIPAKAASELDVRYAEAAGYYFPDEAITHNKAVKRGMKAAASVNLNKIVRDFLHSLSTRHLQYRPALGSYFILSRLAKHKYSGPHGCRVCTEMPDTMIRSNATNFARIKWGAIPKNGLTGHIFILEQSIRETPEQCSKQDLLILKQLIQAIEQLPNDAKARDIEIAWKPHIKSNKQERDALIEIFVASGILRIPSVSQSDFDKIPLKSSWSDHAAVWRGRDGIDQRRVDELFSSVIESSEQG